MDLKSAFKAAYTAAITEVDVFDIALADDIRALVTTLNNKCDGELTFEISPFLTEVDRVVLRCTQQQSENVAVVGLNIVQEEDGLKVTLDSSFTQNRKIYDIADGRDFEAIQENIVLRAARQFVQAEMDARRSAMIKKAFD